MNGKVLGEIGKIKVATYLMEAGYEVFDEYGDNSEIDLVAIKDRRVHLIQVKSGEAKRGHIVLSGCTTTPGTRKTPCRVKKHSDLIDVFALYVRDKGEVLFVNSEELLKNQKGMSIRYEAPKNNQTKKVRWASNYRSFENAALCSRTSGS